MAKEHALRLGKLLGNLQSLETALRLCVAKAGAATSGRTFVLPRRNHSVGDEVVEDAFTNYDSLGVIIARFNTEVALGNTALAVDESVIATRDLLAHGRITAPVPDERTIEIIKFSRPVNGKVRVVASALMSEAWFANNMRLVSTQLERVAKAMESLGLS